MKKFMIIFVIMTLLVSFMIMSSESPKFMNIKNDVMPEEFELTLNSSYMEVWNTMPTLRRSKFTSMPL